MDRLISRLDKALNQQKSITAVFDIDSTIFDVTPRNQEILDLFLHKEKSHNNRHVLKPLEWGIERFLNKDWTPEFKKEAKNFWRRHFFSGTFLPADRPYPNAIEFVNSFKKIGAEILYLTGRDTERMREGSLAQLKHWNLPLNRDEDLFTKPNKGLPDGPYKSQFLDKIIKDRPDQLVLFFDNEPVVLEHCLFEELENYEAFFIESTHSKRMDPKDHWPKISVSDYEKIVKSFESKTL